jgi:hypothetical protein
MTKRVFIIHGWGGYPQEGWFPWLKSELEKKGFVITVPVMPDTDTPVIEKWVGHLAQEVGTPDAETYFVGHSIGCQAILRYLETVDTVIGGAVFVAGFFDLMGMETDDERAIAQPWLQTPIHFERIRQVCPHITAIFSDNDPFVSLENSSEAFKEKLAAKIVVEHDKEHFSGSEGIAELPSALQAVLDMSK